jgi:two-component system sensor histidine kinase YesM
MQNSPQSPANEFINSSTELGRPMDLAVGKAITAGKRVTGYVVFVIPGYYFLNYTDNLSAKIIVTNRYNYAGISNSSTFTDPLGNLKPEVINSRQFFSINDEWYYITQSPILNGELIVYAFTPIKATLTSFLIGGGILMLMIIIVGFATIFGASRVAKSKTKIIDQLVEAFEAVEAGNLDTHLAITTGDEFEIIGDTYNIMLSSLKELIRTNNENTRQTVLSEIKHLESQFNPHFLFNTLENIKFMIKLNPDAAGRMIVCLSALLRYSISNSITDVTLAEDMELTENYLCIQKYRFNSHFKYTLDLADEIRDCIVPKLIIQPVIENSVRYSFQQKEDLTVNIKAELNTDNLLITIRDDGDGIMPDKLAKLRILLESPVNESTHIGLYNISRRIKLMYGEKYGLTLDSEPAVGTCVKMLLPVHRKETKTNA